MGNRTLGALFPNAETHLHALQVLKYEMHWDSQIYSVLILTYNKHIPAETWCFASLLHPLLWAEIPRPVGKQHRENNSSASPDTKFSALHFCPIQKVVRMQTENADVNNNS